MAIRTISATGGNFNAITSWVEGVVPVAADDIVALSNGTSGSLTVNVTSTVRSIDFSQYTATLTYTSQLTVTGASLTNVIASATMSFAGTADLYMNATNQVIRQIGTKRTPSLRLSSTPRTLSSDIYCVNLKPDGGLMSGNFRIYASGNVGTKGTATTIPSVSNLPYSFSSSIEADGSGWISQAFAMPLVISGSYSAPNAGGCQISSIGSITMYPATFSVTSGATISNFNLFIWPERDSNNTQTFIDCPKKINNVFLANSVGSVVGNSVTTLAQTLICDNFLTYDNSRTYTSNNLAPNYIFRGAGISASSFIAGLSIRTGSSAASQYEVTYCAVSLQLQSDNEYTFDNIQLIGGIPSTRAMIRSITGSVPCKINVVNGGSSSVSNYNFQDVNASFGSQIVAINGTVSNVTNIVTTYPTGGGVSGGSFTFVN